MTEDAKNPFSKYVLFCSAVKTATSVSLFGAQDLTMVHRREQETTEGPSRIAFGSCNDQDHQNNLWPIIESRRPAAFVWGGDAIYADTEEMDWSEFPPKQIRECASPGRLHKLYRKQRSVPGYRSLLRSNVTVFGTIDDHDYGCNNADRTFPYKLESAKAFVDFIGETKDSAMFQRARAGHGVYGVKLFDFSLPEGHHLVPEDEAGIDPDIEIQPHVPTLYSNKTVAVFVLDVRTHKTPWKTGSAAFRPDYEGDFLGERQWNWFETAIRRSRASVNVVVNGLQVHGERFPNGNTAESWGKYPLAQQRLFDAILQDGVEAPILVSGDVHMAQLSRKDCHNRETTNVKSLVEMTTSGMTHSWGTLSSHPVDNPGLKPTFKERYESFLAGNLMRFLHALCPWTELMVSQPSSGGLFESGGAEGAKTGTQFSLQKNFGELEFDWEDRTVVVRALGEDKYAAPLLSAKWSIDQLSGRSPIPGSLLQSDDFERQREENPLPQSEWVCVNHGGRVSVMEQIAGHVATGCAFTTLVPFPVLVPGYILLLVTGWFCRHARTWTRSGSSRLRAI